jgi:hypothetical protein
MLRVKPHLVQEIGDGMNTQALKKQLKEKEYQLLADMARGAADSRESRDAEVQDRTDQVASSEMKEGLFQENNYD